MSDVIDITSAKPDPKPAGSIPSSIPEEDRGPLNELFLEMMLLRNGMAALQSQAETLQIRQQAIQQQGVELQKQYDAKLAEVKVRLGIPIHWVIDTRTGATAPPNAQPGAAPAR